MGPLLLGGAPPWAATTIAILAIVALATTVLSIGVRPIGRAPAAWMSVAAVVWTVLQALPLPVGVTAWLAPEPVAHAVQMAGVADAESPRFVPISLSPGSTQLAIVHAVTIAAVLLASWLAVQAGERKRLLQLVAGSTVILAGIALAHGIANATSLFGVYTPVHARPPLVSPLLNPNHLGGFVAMGLPVLIGLGLESKKPTERALWFGLAGPVVLVALLSLSRGAVLSLVAGVLTLLGLLRLRPAERERPRLVAGGAMVIAVVLAIGLYAAASPLLIEFEHGSLEKLELAQQGLDVVAHHGWLGVGRGAFSTAFVHLHGTAIRPVYPENFAVQWASEWGIPFALLLAFAFTLSLSRGAMDARKPARLGAIAGVVAMATHDLVDFALEMPGVAVVAAALFACACAPRVHGELTRGPSRAVRFATMGGAAAVGAIVVAIGAQATTGSVEAIVARIEAAGSEDDLSRALIAAQGTFPAEPVIPLIAASTATRWDDSRVPVLLNRAMRLAPGWHAPHEVAAFWLARQRTFPQAWLEMREAERIAPGRMRSSACMLLAAQPDASLVLQALGVGRESSRRLLGHVAVCGSLPRAGREQIDLALIGTGSEPARVRRARRAIADGDPGAAITMLEGHESAADARFALIDAYLASGRAEEGLRMLDELPDDDDMERRRQIATRRARLLASLGRDEDMRSALSLVRDLAGSSPRRRADAWLLAAELEQRRRNSGHSLRALEEALRLSPDEATVDSVAALAERSGHVARAMQVRTERCRTDGPGSRHCAEAERLRRVVFEPRPLVGQPVP